MTNLQAMQDERLRDLIHQVEQLERLYNNVPKFKTGIKPHLVKQLSDLEMEIRQGKSLITKRWRELLEE